MPSVFGTPSKNSGGFLSSSLNSVTAGNVITSVNDAIAVVVFCSGGATTTCTIADSIVGNNYTVVGSPSVTGTNSNIAGSIFVGYLASSTGSTATNAVKATFNTNQSYAQIYVWSIPVTGFAAFDVSAFGHSASASNAPITAAFTTTGTDEFVAVMAGNDFTGQTYSAGSGYTLDSSGFNTGTGGSQHRLFTTTQSGITAAMGQSGSTDWLIGLVAFKATTPPPPTNDSCPNAWGNIFTF